MIWRFKALLEKGVTKHMRAIIEKARTLHPEKFRRILPMHTSISDEVVEETESDSPQQCPATGQEATGTNWNSEKLHLYAMEHFFLCEGCPTLAQVAQNIMESPSWEVWSWATFQVDPALRRRVGLDNLKGSLPTSIIVWSCDFRASGSQPCVSCTALKIPLPAYQDAHPQRQTFNPINLKCALRAQLSHLFLWQEVMTTHCFLIHKKCCLERQPLSKQCKEQQV